MGPPPFGDGNAERDFAAIIPGQRFNGATAFRRWKRFHDQTTRSPYPWLQWGHRLSAMETTGQPYILNATPALQWGHRLSAMETAEALQMSVPSVVLQWGHRLSAMETAESETKASRALLLQWGHRLSAMET